MKKRQSSTNLAPRAAELAVVLEQRGVREGGGALDAGEGDGRGRGRRVVLALAAGGARLPRLAERPEGGDVSKLVKPEL